MIQVENFDSDVLNFCYIINVWVHDVFDLKTWLGLMNRKNSWKLSIVIYNQAENEKTLKYILPV